MNHLTMFWIVLFYQINFIHSNQILHFKVKVNQQEDIKKYQEMNSNELLSLSQQSFHNKKKDSKRMSQINSNEINNNLIYNKEHDYHDDHDDYNKNDKNENSLTTTTTTTSQYPQVCYRLHGIPKSGTTWLTALLKECNHIYCKQYIENDKNNLNNNKCLKCNNMIAYKKHDINIIFKEQQQIDHHFSSSTFHNHMNNLRHIFIFRDTRDVLVSHYHWSRHGFNNIASFTRNHTYGILQIIKEQNDFITTIKKCLKIGNGHFIYYIIYYENLKLNISKETILLLKFLKINISINEMNSAINLTSFDNMRQNEMNGHAIYKVHPNSAKTLSNITPSSSSSSSSSSSIGNDLFGVMTRKGIVGSWKEELNDGTIAYVEEMMKEYLDPFLLKRYLPSIVTASSSSSSSRLL